LFNKFLPTANEDPLFSGGRNEEGGQGTNLADLILEKIAAHEAAQVDLPTVHRGEATEVTAELPAKVVEVYSK
jgi:hypothetical protein